MENHLIPMDHDACGVGFVTQLGGTASHEVVERALEALIRLSHRGGVDADGRSGDGAGLLLPIPEKFFRHAARQLAIDLPAVFGLGMVFLPAARVAESRRLVEDAAVRNQVQCLGWREVPTDCSTVGPRARDTLPVIQQCFFTSAHHGADLELRLFRMRKECEVHNGIYFCSLSPRTVVYKGLLTPRQLPAFYSDLTCPEFKTSFAIFHQRYSTNTQPSW